MPRARSSSGDAYWPMITARRVGFPHHGEDARRRHFRPGVRLGPGPRMQPGRPGAEGAGTQPSSWAPARTTPTSTPTSHGGPSASPTLPMLTSRRRPEDAKDLMGSFVAEERPLRVEVGADGVTGWCVGEPWVVPRAQGSLRLRSLRGPQRLRRVWPTSSPPPSRPMPRVRTTSRPRRCVEDTTTTAAAGAVATEERRTRR